MPTLDSKKSVYIFGNHYLRKDSLPVKLLPYLQKKFPQYSFCHLDPTEGIPPDTHLICLDTVVGLPKVTVFNNLNDFLPPPHVSLHDYDLYMELKLLLKTGRLKKITLIGIPDKGDLKTICKVARAALAKVDLTINYTQRNFKKCEAQLMQGS